MTILAEFYSAIFFGCMHNEPEYKCGIGFKERKKRVGEWHK
jgi:hypothetical protein